MVEANKDKDGATSYKVVMLGESGVGKTCIVNRYIKGLYSVTETTIGSNYSSKIETVSSARVAQPQKVKLQIWDTAGSEQFRSLTPIYYKNAAAVCIVYDSTSAESFDGMSFWIDELKSQTNAANVILSIVASKVDNQDAEEVSVKKAADFAKSIKAEFYQTSSKDGTGINQLFADIAERLYLQTLSQGEVVSTH